MKFNPKLCLEYLEHTIESKKDSLSELTMYDSEYKRELRSDINELTYIKEILVGEKDWINLNP